MTILKDEEDRKKEIQVVKQIIRANGYQPEEGARKGKQNTTVLKYSGAVPYIGKHTDKVTMAFNNLDVNVGISNDAAMVKRSSNERTREVQSKAGRKITVWKTLQ